MGDAVGVIVFVIIIVISIIGRVLQAATERDGAEKQAGGGGGGGGEYSASPDDIRRFLEDLESPRRARTQEPPSPPREAPGGGQPSPAPTRLAEQDSDAWEAESGQDQGMPTGPVEDQPTVAPVGRRTRKEAARRKALKQRIKQRASAGTKVTRKEHVVPTQPGKSDLKSAVIWSEILGPPVARRRRPGHRPPGPPK